MAPSKSIVGFLWPLSIKARIRPGKVEWPRASPIRDWFLYTFIVPTIDAAMARSRVPAKTI